MSDNQQIISPERVVQVFNPYKAQLVQLREENEKQAFDYSTKSGRKDARSHIFKIRQSKAAVEKKRKDEKSDILEAGRQIDSVAKEIIGELEAMIDYHLKPVEEAEAAEQKRIDDIKDKIITLAQYANCQGMSADAIEASISTLEAVEITEPEYAEFVEEALQERFTALDKMRIALDAQKKVEAEQAELNRLRQEAKEREEKEAEERRQREERERADAERLQKDKARVERLTKDMETLRDYQISHQGVDAAGIAKMLEGLKATVIRGEDWHEFHDQAVETKTKGIEILERALTAQQQVEEQQAEMKRLREENDRREREAREAREAKEKAEREAAEAEQREKDRLEREERERKEREEAEEKRKAEEAERERKAKEQEAKIRQDIEHFYLSHCAHDTPEQCAEAVADALILGRIPHVVIKFEG